MAGCRYAATKSKRKALRLCVYGVLQEIASVFHRLGQAVLIASATPGWAVRSILKRIFLKNTTATGRGTMNYNPDCLWTYLEYFHLVKLCSFFVFLHVAHVALVAA